MLKLTIVAVLCALVAGAYWGTPPSDAAPRPGLHCLVFKFDYVQGTWVLLDQKPVKEIPCPASRSRRA